MHHKLVSALAALAAAGLAVTGRWAVGSVRGALEAVELIASLIDSALYLLSTTATVGGTTIALMLTIIGVARRADHDFEMALYRQIMLIAVLSATGLALSVILLLAMSVPYGGLEKLSPGGYAMIYEVLYAGTALVVVLAVVTVTLLTLTIRQLIIAITPGQDMGDVAGDADERGVSGEARATHAPFSGRG